MMCENKMKHFKLWFTGLILSTILLWILGAFFVSPVPDWSKSEELGIYVRRPGSVQRHIKEGWAESVYGKYDIIGIDDVTKVDSNKVAIWGDSFVEGHQLPDDEKLAQQFSEVCRENGIDELLGVGIGGSGRSVPDYYNLMPAYEKVVNPVFHVIVISSFGDISPDGVRFLNQPFRITEYNNSKRFIGVRHFLNSLSLNFFYPRLEKFMDSGIDLRFGLGEVKSSDSEEEISDSEQEVPVDAWDFLLAKLRQRTELPILIVYTPPVPQIKEGELIYDDFFSSSGQTEKLADLCKKNGIGYIDMKQRNITFFEKTGNFPRGFNNGGFTTGHCNKYGHHLIAEAIYDYIKENLNGIYTD